MVQHVEYLISRTDEARRISEALRDELRKIADIPRALLTCDLELSRDEKARFLRAIDDAREAAWHQVNALTTELEVLHAAADDVIGKVGRLV